MVGHGPGGDNSIGQFYAVLGEAMVGDSSKTRLDCEVSYREGWLVAAPRGSLDLGVAPLLWKQLRDLTEEPRSKVVLDLSAVDYMDSSTLSTLVRISQHMDAVRGQLRLVIPERRLLRLLEVTGLQDSFAVYPSLGVALA